MSRTVYRAQSTLATADDWFRGGGVVVQAGRVVALARSDDELRRLQRPGDELIELEGVLTAGLVNAHVHLELAPLPADVPRDFIPWVGSVLAARGAQTVDDVARQVRAGAAQALRTGTTCVGEFDGSGISGRELADGALAARVFVELIDGCDPARLAAASERVDAASGARAGFAPHAPHTVSDPLLAKIAAAAHALRAPVSAHWAETDEELAWLEEGTGPFAGLLSARPEPRFLERLERVGLLQPTTSLVHANLARESELACVIGHGLTLVHCPGTHAYFDREPFGLTELVQRGARIALGTDSLASNAALDLRLEMQRVRSAAPGLAPASVWRMATENGARVVDLEVGALRVGARADMCAFAVEDTTHAGVLERLTGSSPAVLGVWVGGRAAARRRENAPESET